ncbi:MAG TPA: ester cyclase [Thermomicrobiales bacterium]|nr:ester cyclase [Thermomicrobiales bacterium]
MSTEDNKALGRRFVEEVYNQGNVDAVDVLVSDQFVRHGIGGTMRGREIIKERVRAVRSGFPDFRITIEDALADGDKVVLRQTHTGTHLGEFAGVAPTGVRMETTEISILRIADGKICEGWVSVDQLTMLRQIGALPV